ncbi:MAG: flagellar biosynthesis protein FlhB [Bradymonadia bacterium]
MSEGGGGERTEKATPKRREDARKKGDVARSRDVATVLIVFAGFTYLTLFGGRLREGVSSLIRRCFGELEGPLKSSDAFIEFTGEIVALMAGWLAPLFGGVVLLAILGNVAQVGWLITFEPLKPDLTKLNPLPNLKNIFFSKRTLGNLVTNVAKVTVVASVVALTIRSDAESIAVLSQMPLMAGMETILSTVLQLMLNTGLALIAIAGADFAWNKYLYEEKLKMSKHDVKEEAKEQEGNPLMKGARMRRARELSNNRMMQAVPEADVVLNNPTHLSIALRYRQGVDAAPVVVAKGADLVAMRIRRIAAANDVPMLEDKPLARLLFKRCEVGQAVPEEVYRAVAEVLAYVYQLKGKTG